MEFDAALSAYAGRKRASALPLQCVLHGSGISNGSDDARGIAGIRDVVESSGAEYAAIK